MLGGGGGGVLITESPTCIPGTEHYSLLSLNVGTVCILIWNPNHPYIVEHSGVYFRKICIICYHVPGTQDHRPLLRLPSQGPIANPLRNTEATGGGVELTIITGDYS